MPDGMPPGMGGMPGAGPGGPPPGMPGGMPGGNTPPMAAPMSTQEPAEGLKQSARVNAHIAMTLLEQALPGLGSESPEGQAVLKALHALSKVTDEHAASGSKELVPAELMSLLQQAPGAGLGGGGGMPPSGMPPPGGAGGALPGGVG